MGFPFDPYELKLYISGLIDEVDFRGGASSVDFVGERGGGGSVKSDAEPVLIDKPLGVEGRGSDAEPARPSAADSGAPETETDFAGVRSSSMTVDCLLRLSSSSSSAISINLRLRRELVEEDVEPDAVCKEQAAESFVSRSSLAFAISNMVS